MTWNEEDHPRDREGQFTHASVGSWARQAAAQLSVAAKRRGEARPPGHAAAAERSQQLWAVTSSKSRGGQGRDRTDAEQAELDQLEQAFEAYRNMLGLRRSKHFGNTTYADDLQQLYDEYGQRIEGRDVRHVDAPPIALARGYTRVGDHPRGVGRVGGDDDGVFTPSTHPQAGGLWVDPAMPGTRHAPRYLNDVGHLVSEVQPDRSRASRFKSDRQFRRATGMYGSPDELNYREARSTQPRVRLTDRLGYGMAEAEGGAAFVAHMKRVQPRVRQEAAREPVRRTPRGTQVEGWMGQVDARIARTRGGR